jgi:transposase InsO family protein
MTEELQELGLDVGHRRVGRLMAENAITAVRTRKYKVTTDSNHAFAHLGKRFTGSFPYPRHLRTYWSGISRSMLPIRNGPETSATSGPVKVGCTWPSFSTSTPVV